MTKALIESAPTEMTPERLATIFAPFEKIQNMDPKEVSGKIAFAALKNVMAAYKEDPVAKKFFDKLTRAMIAEWKKPGKFPKGFDPESWQALQKKGDITEVKDFIGKDNGEPNGGLFGLTMVMLDQYANSSAEDHNVIREIAIQAVAFKALSMIYGYEHEATDPPG